MWGVVLGAALLLAPVPVSAHAFPERSDPLVVFSAIRVENEGRERVDKGDGRVDSQDQKLLEVSLSPLPPGKYRVFWSVVARDGHRTEGDFPFQVE
jgi:methionine-rich copper-binding protein CopC